MSIHTERTFRDTDELKAWAVPEMIREHLQCTDSDKLAELHCWYTERDMCEAFYDWGLGTDADFDILVAQSRAIARMRLEAAYELLGING